MKLLEVGLITATVIVAQGAFSWASRREIEGRAGSASELSGRFDRPLEASHNNHTRCESYDRPGNGRLVLDTEHFAYHLLYRDSALDIGLTETQNEWALKQIWNRIAGFSLTRSLSPDETMEEIHKGLDLWRGVLV